MTALAWVATALRRVIPLGSLTATAVFAAVAQQRVVDAYTRLREAVYGEGPEQIEAASVEYKNAIAEDPDAAEVIGKTIATVQRVDSFAVMCAVVDKMFEVVTAATYTRTREKPPGARRSVERFPTRIW